MSDEQTTSPEAAVVETPQVDTFDYGNAAEEVDAGADDSNDGAVAGDEGGDALSAEATPEDDSEEVEYDGKKHKIPKVLKDALMRHADYTQKTQEVAAHRRELDSRAQSIEQQAKAQQENIQEYAALVAVNHRLQQFNQVNWGALNQEDPVQAQALWIEYSQLKDIQNNVSGKLQQKEQSRVREEQQKALLKDQEIGNRRKQCFDTVARDVKGWSPDLAASVSGFAMKELGYTDQELKEIDDPRMVKALHRAYVADQILKKQTAKPAAVQAKPVPQVGANSAPAGRKLADMSMAEYVKARRAQLR